MNRDLEKFLLGFKAYFDSFFLVLRYRTLKKYAFFPFLIYLSLLILGVWGLSSLVSSFVAYMTGLTSGLGFLAGVIGFIVTILSWGVGFVMLVYSIYLIASVIASPFNSILAERTLMTLNIIEKNKMGFSESLKSASKMAWVGLLKAGIFTVLGIGLFLLSFIPGLNVVCSFFLVLIMAFDFSDYSFETLQYNLRQRFQYFRDNFAAFCGMASAMGLTMLIPGLNFFLFPIAVVGTANMIAQLKGLEDGTRSHSQEHS